MSPSLPRYVAVACGVLAIAIRGFFALNLVVFQPAMVWLLLSELIGIVVPLGLWFVICRPALQRRGTLELDPANQRLLAHTRGTAAGFGVAVLAVTLLQSLLERVPYTNRMRLSTVPGILPTSAVLVVMVVGLALGFILLDRPRLTMNAEGMSLAKYPFRSRHIAWDAIVPGTVALRGRRARSLTWRQVKRSAPARILPALSTFSLIVDPALLEHAVRTYVDQPDRRAEVGTDAGLARLLAEYTSTAGAPAV